MQETQQTQENYASKKQKYTQAQVTQLTQAVLAEENATIESILFFTQRTLHKRLRCVRLNGNRASERAYRKMNIHMLPAT